MNRIVGGAVGKSFLKKRRVIVGSFSDVKLPSWWAEAVVWGLALRLLVGIR